MRVGATLCALLVTVAWQTLPRAADTTAAPAGVQVRPLGGGRFQIGSIVVDKAGARFTVPGKRMDLGSPDAPLEFVAGTRGGDKLYETLIELDADAVEFNVACILVGLDAARSRGARQHFDPEPVQGMAVDLFVEWREGDVTVRRSAAELIRAGSGSPLDDWVYTGSRVSRDGRFMAQEHGTLVGFVHAPESLIEHRTGIGLGDYGAAIVNADTAPPPGVALTFTLAVRRAP